MQVAQTQKLTLLGLFSFALAFAPSLPARANPFRGHFTFLGQFREVLRLKNGNALFTGAHPQNDADFEELFNRREISSVLTLLAPDREKTLIEQERAAIERFNQKLSGSKEGPVQFFSTPLGMLWKSQFPYLSIWPTWSRENHRFYLREYPTHEQIVNALRTIHEQLKTGNVYVACKYGSERSGYITAAALVLFQGMSKEDAFQAAALDWKFSKLELWLLKEWKKMDLNRCGEIGQAVMGQGDCAPLPAPLPDCKSEFQRVNPEG